jgi:DNA adenine methylase
LHYIGGKQKSGGHRIAAAIKQFAALLGTDQIVEPFCGGLSVTYRLGLNVDASDACVPLISMYRALQDGWIPPSEVDRATWDRYKVAGDPTDPMTAFVGFGCSRSGAWFSSFVSQQKFTKRHVPSAVAARDSLLKKLSACKSTTFKAYDYADAPVRGVWYCDIPYVGTLGYPAVGPFDHTRFWSHANEVSQQLPVLVSECVAPEDWSVVDEWSVQQRLNTPTATRRMERLFIHERWT